MEVGFTREVFKKKQVLADQRFAEKIQSRDTTTSSSSAANALRHRTGHSMSMGGHSNYHRQIEELEGLEELLGLAGANQREIAQNLNEIYGHMRRGHSHQ